MNERHPELTSALLDGELDSKARQRFVSEITGPEPDELERFERYCLIGDAIRGESSVLAVSVARRVHESLADEPVVLAPARQASKPWLIFSAASMPCSMSTSPIRPSITSLPSLTLPISCDTQPLSSLAR